MISGMESKVVYLSGPMTGCEDWNRRAFAEAERECYESGARQVFNPAGDAPYGEDPNPHSYWMLRDAHELTRLGYGNHPYYDTLLQLPGWERSRGARFEREIAAMCGTEVKEVI